MQNLAALRAAVFPLSAKNLRGGVKPPPGPARVNVLVLRHAIRTLHGAGNPYG